MESANRRPPSRRGFTLIEMCIVLAISAVLLGLAVPSMVRFRQEQKLRATAEALASDLRFARFQAVQRGEPVFFRVSGRGTQSCYVLHTGVSNACDCAGGVTSCNTPDAEVIRAVWLPVSEPTRLSSNPESLQFRPLQTLSTKFGSVEVSLDGGMTIRQVVAISGRVRSCYAGLARVNGMRKCD